MLQSLLAYFAAKPNVTDSAILPTLIVDATLLHQYYVISANMRAPSSISTLALRQCRSCCTCAAPPLRWLQLAGMREVLCASGHGIGRGRGVGGRTWALGAVRGCCFSTGAGVPNGPTSVLRVSCRHYNIVLACQAP